MTYEIQQKVLFKHCDPAGIVFYPRYFEIINDTVEHFFDEVLHLPFETLHSDGSAVPAADIHVKFHAPSRHGDQLTIRLDVNRLGNSSLDLTIVIASGEEKRLTAKLVIVNVGNTGRSRPWSDDMRAIVTPLITP